MANLHAAKKAIRQQERRRIRNLVKKKAMLDVMRDIKKFIAQGKKDEALKLLPSAYKIFDKAAKTGFIKKNTAARNKSRLTALTR